MTVRYRQTSEAFSLASFHEVARVLVRRAAFDLAMIGPERRTIVIRVTDRVTESDRLDLETMLAEGTFARAAIVYQERGAACRSGPVETYHVSDVSTLVAKLAAESETAA